MIKFTVRRLLQMIPVFIGATFLIYWIVFSLPGDPTAGKCGDRPCPEAYVAQFEEEYNLNDPLLVQYGKYMAGVVQGDFGESFYGVAVSEELSERFAVTAKLALMALGIEAVIGISAGVLAALKKGGFLDNVVLISTLAVIALPVFVTGSVLQLYLGIKLGWFPVTVGADTSFYALLLPAFVLGSVSLAYLARLMRTNLSENLRSDYVRTARAKGLPETRVVGIHTLRNSLIPVVTFLGYDLGALMGGAIITEGIFNIPGVGNYIYRAIGDRDGVVVVGSVTALILVYLVANLVVDLLYGVLDPRISHE